MTQLSTILPPHNAAGAAKTSTPALTFAFCVEAGGFESMTLRAVQSLRRFGGRFAHCRVIACTPRRGRGLDTKREKGSSS